MSRYEVDGHLPTTLHESFKRVINELHLTTNTNNEVIGTAYSHIFKIVAAVGKGHHFTTPPNVPMWPITNLTQ